MGGKDSGREDSGSRNKETCNFDWKGLKKALQTQYHWGRVLKENIPLATKKGNASQLEVTIITKEKKKKNTQHIGKGTGTLVTDHDAPKGVEWGWVVCDLNLHA